MLRLTNNYEGENWGMVIIGTETEISRFIKKMGINCSIPNPDSKEMCGIWKGSFGTWYIMSATESILRILSECGNTEYEYIINNVTDNSSMLHRTVFLKKNRFGESFWRRGYEKVSYEAINRWYDMKREALAK